MKDLAIVLLFNIWITSRKLTIVRDGDRELEEIAYTYERPVNARQSNPYRKMKQYVFIIQSVSFISTIVTEIMGKYCTRETFLILYILSWVYILDWPSAIVSKETNGGRKRSKKAIASSIPMAKDAGVL